MARRSLSPRAGCADAGILFRRRTGRETRVIHVAWPNLLVSAIRGGWSTRRNAREEGRGKREEAREEQVVQSKIPSRWNRHEIYDR
jgi:hypothetical protein